MVIKRKSLAYSLSLGLLLSASVTNAQAACSAINGIWYLHGVEVETSANGAAHASVLKCTVNMTAGGDFTNAPCVSYDTDGAVYSTQAAGNITVAANCDFSGTVTLAGEPRNLIIRGGHFNNTMATAIATKRLGSTTRNVVYHLTLIKKN